jgi:hypothetical protein
MSRFEPRGRYVRPAGDAASRGPSLAVDMKMARQMGLTVSSVVAPANTLRGPTGPGGQN